MESPLGTVHRHIDELLGDSEGRFFGAGYRRTNPALRGLAITHDAEWSSAKAIGSLGIAGTWSEKGGTRQVPHLGTTDVIVLALRLAESLVTSRHFPGAWQQARVSALSVRAGRAPIEEELEGFVCDARLAPTGDGSEVVAGIGSMTVRIELVHAGLSLGLAGIEAPDECPLVGPASERLYGTRWSERAVEVRDIELAPGWRRASAVVELAGLDSGGTGELSLVDLFVAPLQLGQVLLYGLDDLSRATSDTLWMRSTQCAVARAAPVSGSSFSVSLEGARTVTKNGEIWRCADVVGYFSGAELRCSVAHRIARPGASAGGGDDA